MIVIAGYYRFPPENLTAAAPAMASMIAASRAEAGCLHYSYAHDMLEPGLIRVSEAWADQAAFDAHVASPHMSQWRAAGATHGLYDRTITGYDAASSRPL